MLDFDYTWTAEQMRSWIERAEPVWDGPFKDDSRRMQCIAGFDADERPRIGALIDAYWSGRLTTEAFINRFEAGLWPATAADPAAPALLSPAAVSIPQGVPMIGGTRPSKPPPERCKVACLRCQRAYEFVGPPRGPVACPAEGCGGRLEQRGSDAWAIRDRLYNERHRLSRKLWSIPHSEQGKAMLTHAQEKFTAFTAMPPNLAPDTPVHLYGRKDGTIGFVANDKVAKIIAPNETGGVEFILHSGQILRKKMYLGVSARTRALEILDTEW